MVFRRMKDMVSATIHEGLDKMENPRVMLNHYLREMENEIVKAKHAIVKQETLKQHFKRLLDESSEMATKRRNQAQLTFDAGAEDLSRKALVEMKRYEANCQNNKDVYEKAVIQVRELQEQLRGLERRFQALKDKKYALIARANAVKAKEHMLTSMNRMEGENAIKEFERLEERITETEIRVNTWAGFPSAQEAFAKLEYADEAEKELERMRRAKGRADAASVSSVAASGDIPAKTHADSPENPPTMSTDKTTG